ncbi:MAG: hypothetical protein ABJB40_04090 [Acidobacteriota bacterium]
MMNPNRKNSANGSGTPTSIWLKLGGLFVLSLAVAFVAFFGYDLLSAYTENASARPVGEQAPPIVIDPKIESDLAKALAFDPSPATDAAKDPFTDRGGLSGRMANAAVASVQGSGATSRSSNGGTVVGSTRSGTSTSVGGGPAPAAVQSTKERYEQWMGKYGISGDVPLDPRLFSIEDLLPVGIVDGGSGQQEVMFFSEAAGKTLSFPIGTLFYDGWLTELRPEGVVFSSSDRRTIRMRSWARSIRNAG